MTCFHHIELDRKSLKYKLRYSSQSTHSIFKLLFWSHAAYILCFKGIVYNFMKHLCRPEIRTSINWNWLSSGTEGCVCVPYWPCHSFWHQSKAWDDFLFVTASVNSFCFHLLLKKMRISCLQHKQPQPFWTYTYMVIFYEMFPLWSL